MYRTFFAVVLLLVCATVYAAPHNPAYTPGNDRLPSIDSQGPGIPEPSEPPRIMDDTLQFWNFESAAQRSAWSFLDLTDLAPQWHPDTVPGRGTDSAWWCGSKTMTTYGNNGYGNYWYQAVQTPMLNLTGTTNPTLACKLWYSFEPVGTSGGYDGVTLWISTNGGNTWAVISNPTPAYNATNLNAASPLCWNLGTVPGYSGVSGGAFPGSYQITTVGLSNFRRDSIMVRWTLLSDRAISAESRGIYAPLGLDSLFGCFLDSIRISDGATSIFSDNGGRRGTNTLQPTRTRGIGQHWEWSTRTSMSPTYSAHTADNFPSQQACLVSPPITVPMRSTYFRYAVLCNMLDSVQSGPAPQTTLRHFYQIEVVGPDSVVKWITTDYMRGGHGANNWYSYGPGSGYSGDTSLNLTRWAGQTIRLRFKAITDYDTTRIAPTNPGLWIDDVRIMADNRTVFDISPVEMHIPFPTTVGTVWGAQPFVRIVNRGRGQLNNVTWSLRSDTTWVNVGTIPVAWPDSSWQFSFNFPLTQPGTLHPAVRITMPTTPTPTIKTLDLGEMPVIANGSFELGYDSRHFWISDSLDAGITSFAEKFTPIADGYEGTYNVRNMRFATRGGGAGSVRVRLMTPSGNRPGIALVDTLINVPAAADTVVVWRTIDLQNRPEGRDQTGNIYVVLQQEGTTHMPFLAADTQFYGIGHCYTWAGGTTTPIVANHDYAIRLTIDWVNSVPERISALMPDKLALSAAPNPFNPTTRIAVDIPTSGLVNIAVYDLTGRVVEVLHTGRLSAGSYGFEWNAARFASGVYFVKVNIHNQTMTRKITLLK